MNASLALEQWKIAEPIRLAVRWHHDPKQRHLSQIVALADTIANAIGYSVLPLTTVLVDTPPEETVAKILQPECPAITAKVLLENFRNEMDVIRGAPCTPRS